MHGWVPNSRCTPGMTSFTACDLTFGFGVTTNITELPSLCVEGWQHNTPIWFNFYIFLNVTLGITTLCPPLSGNTDFMSVFVLNQLSLKLQHKSPCTTATTTQSTATTQTTAATTQSAVTTQAAVKTTTQTMTNTGCCGPAVYIHWHGFTSTCICVLGAITFFISRVIRSILNRKRRKIYVYECMHNWQFSMMKRWRTPSYTAWVQSMYYRMRENT